MRESLKYRGLGWTRRNRSSPKMGVDAETFPSAGEFSSWVGICPGSNVTAEENHSSRSPKGNRFVRKILTQAAHAAVKKKGCHFQSLFRRFLPKLGCRGAIWVVAHRLARLVWKILHDGVRYLEQGIETNPQAKKRRARRLAQALRKLGVTRSRSPQSVPTRSRTARRDFQGSGSRGHEDNAHSACRTHQPSPSRETCRRTSCASRGCSTSCPVPCRRSGLPACRRAWRGPPGSAAGRTSLRCGRCRRRR